MKLTETLARKILGLAAVMLLVGIPLVAKDDFLSRVEHGYATNGDVKIHYASLGEGPLVVMVHGFPDYWYTWRHQMEALADDFRVVAIDQRGYNKSGHPEGQANYNMKYLVGDVVAVIKSLGEERATVVGHDWGGAVAWQVALNVPQVVENLVILNLPHPNGLAREFANNAEQQANSGYARKFREGKPSDPDIFFGMPMRPETISGWVRDPEARKLYAEAFKRSDFDAMLAYYKENYGSDGPGTGKELPKLEMPVLQFHGLKDPALHSDGLNNTWDWIAAEYTLVTAPEAGHFVQQDAEKLVSETLRWWLLARKKTRE